MRGEAVAAAEALATFLRRQAGVGPLDEGRPLKLGKLGQHAEHHAPGRGGVVHAKGRDDDPDATRIEVAHHRQRGQRVASQAIDLPGDQAVARLFPARRWRTARRRPPALGTFHGLGARQLRADPEVGGLRENFDILDADDSKRLVKRIVKAMNLREAEEAGPDERDPVKVIYGLIGKLKDRRVPAEQAISYVESLIARENQRRAAVDAYSLCLTARVYIEYQRLLREANIADFGDLLLWPALTMLRDPEYREC